MKPTDETQTTDEVLEEVRRIKDALAKAMDYDIRRIVEDARHRQYESGRQIISPPVRPAS